MKKKVTVHVVGHVTADPLKLMKTRLIATKKMRRTKSIGRYEYHIQIVSVPSKVCVKWSISSFGIREERSSKEVKIVGTVLCLLKLTFVL